MSEMLLYIDFLGDLLIGAFGAIIGSFATYYIESVRTKRQKRKRKTELIEEIALENNYLKESEILNAFENFIKLGGYKKIEKKRDVKIFNIPKYLMNHIIRIGNEQNKLVFLTAESGMGKTTILINLLLEIKWNNQFKVGYYAINETTLEEILQIDKDVRKKTVLLLDALDECSVKWVNQFLETKLSKLGSFGRIIIASRPEIIEHGEKIDPSIYTESGEKYDLQLLNISSTSKTQVLSYLFFKQGVLSSFKWKNYLKILKFIFEDYDLFSRPILLSFIQQIDMGEISLKNNINVYESFIKEWFKNGIKKIKKDILLKNNGIDKFLTIGNEISYVIYCNHTSNGGLFIEKSVLHSIYFKLFKEFIQFEDFIWLLPITVTPNGQYRFIHKSIFEYFITKYAFENRTTHIILNIKEFDLFAQNVYEQFIYERLYQRDDSQTKFFLKEEYYYFINFKSIKSCDFQRITDIFFYVDDGFDYSIFNYLYVLEKLKKIYFYKKEITVYLYILLYIEKIRKNSSTEVIQDCDKLLNIENFEEKQIIRTFLKENEYWIEDSMKKSFTEPAKSIFHYGLRSPNQYYFSIIRNELIQLVDKDNFVLLHKLDARIITDNELHEKLKGVVKQLKDKKKKALVSYLKKCENIKNQNEKKTIIKVYTPELVYY